jgi:pimeloyl-ACP methyl ester carboxylesterase
MKILGVLVVLILLFLVLTSIYHWHVSNLERSRYTAPGELFQVDGTQVHMQCQGEGSPVMVLESGLMSGSTSWFKVFEPLSRITRVCAYDRPGMDWSEPRRKNSSSAEVARRLAMLLDQAEITDPVILVGMSAGGVYAREFQQQFPDRVVGMGLVDSSHEQQGSRLPEVEGQASAQTILKLCGYLAPTGLLRVAGAFKMVLESMGLEEQDMEQALAMSNRNHTCPSVLQEMISFEADLQQPITPRSLGDLPLVVLSQGAEPDLEKMPPGFTPELAEEMRLVWNELQLELTALSSRGRRVVAENSGHVIQLEQPDLVIAELAQLVAEVRAIETVGD